VLLPQYPQPPCKVCKTCKACTACKATLGGQWQWNLVPLPPGVDGSRSYHTWGGLDVEPTDRTPRSYGGANTTAVYSVDSAGQLRISSVERRVTISGLPHDVNMSFPTTGYSPGLPCFYGGPVRLADGRLVAASGGPLATSHIPCCLR
jgi:hypothetical protein